MLPGYLNQWLFKPYVLHLLYVVSFCPGGWWKIPIKLWVPSRYSVKGSCYYHWTGKGVHSGHRPFWTDVDSGYSAWEWTGVWLQVEKERSVAKRIVLVWSSSPFCGVVPKRLSAKSIHLVTPHTCHAVSQSGTQGLRDLPMDSASSFVTAPPSLHPQVSSCWWTHRSSLICLLGKAPPSFGGSVWKPLPLWRLSKHPASHCLPLPRTASTATVLLECLCAFPRLWAPRVHALTPLAPRAWSSVSFWLTLFDKGMQF